MDPTSRSNPGNPRQKKNRIDVTGRNSPSPTPVAPLKSGDRGWFDGLDIDLALALIGAVQCCPLLLVDQPPRTPNAMLKFWYKTQAVDTVRAVVAG
ncbi:hypothetical protein B0G76_8438 [Paraburkholderia sp. BL23I1N1]|nr:hypothetical protein B0G76_8438 [Paraburkholderia sp. BL23I1N1]